MTILPVMRIGDPVLRRRAEEVPVQDIPSAEIQGLIDAMIATMRDAPGVGLAAPQVGHSLRIIVVEDPQEAVDHLSEQQRNERQRITAFPLHVFVNPRLRAAAGTSRAIFPEGCLSIPGYAGLVERDVKIEVAFFDRHALFHDWTPFQGWAARIVQHEIDHLDGVLYTDRLAHRSFMTEENMKQRTQGRLVTALIEELAHEAGETSSF